MTTPDPKLPTPAQIAELRRLHEAATCDSDCDEWWCDRCDRTVGSAFVKFDESHEACGEPVRSYRAAMREVLTRDLDKHLPALLAAAERLGEVEGRLACASRFDAPEEPGVYSPWTIEKRVGPGWRLQERRGIAWTLTLHDSLDAAWAAAEQSAKAQAKEADRGRHE